MKCAVWDISLPGDGTGTYARTMAAVLDADVFRMKGGCRTPQQLAERFMKYDLVLMSSIQWHAMEKEPESSAWHVQIAQEIGRRLVPFAHNPFDKSFPDWHHSTHYEAIIGAAGHCLSNSVVNMSVARGRELRADVIVVPIPYISKYAGPREDRRRHAVLTTGRVTKWKGFDQVYRSGWSGEHIIAGTSSFVEGPAFFSRLVKEGAEVNFAPDLTAGGDYDRHSEWEVEVKRGVNGVEQDLLLRYTGDYDTKRGTEPPHDEGAVHFTGSISHHLEYTTLEALDKGIRCIVPARARDRAYSNAIATFDCDDLTCLPGVIDAAIEAGDVDPRYDLDLHDPRHVVNALRLL